MLSITPYLDCFLLLSLLVLNTHKTLDYRHYSAVLLKLCCRCLVCRLHQSGIGRTPAFSQAALP